MEMSDKLDMLIESVSEMKQLLTAVYHRQEVTDARLEALSMDVHHMKGDIAELKADVAVLKQDVAVLKQDVAVLKQDVAVLKKDTADLKKGQARHESILQTLALRSIEYESALHKIIQS